MLRRIALRDFAIVRELEIEFGAGFTVLTGETGAGKSILIDALQMALGARGEAVLVREGATRAEVVAEFDTPPALQPWLQEAGFEGGATLMLRRSHDTQGRSRAWINGSAATVTQLRQAAEHLVEIHGQHAWQSLTRPQAVRALLDEHGGVQLVPMLEAWQGWKAAQDRLRHARDQRDRVDTERERLQWQLAELSRLAPTEGEWATLNAEHTRLSNAQALLDAVGQALAALSEAEPSAQSLTSRASARLLEAERFDPQLQSVSQLLESTLVQLGDVAHSLQTYLRRCEPDPGRLAELDHRVSEWLQLARRHRRQPDELPALFKMRQAELAALEAAHDLEALELQEKRAAEQWREEARKVSLARQRASGPFARAVTQAMQSLGMAGGVFEVRLEPTAEPQSFGLEQVAFHVAGHAGASPRALAKVASGGELSRLALAIAVSALREGQRPSALIFDEIDAGVGGAVADSVGRMMKRLGGGAQVLAVTHLAQVAACADAHLVVSKALEEGRVCSRVQAVQGETRVEEIARMLGGERLSGTSRAHAQALLGQGS